jgi:hypothetical protein
MPNIDWTVLGVFLSVVVLAIQAFNSYQHMKTRADLAELKTYIHEFFVSKDDYRRDQNGLHKRQR